MKKLEREPLDGEVNPNHPVTKFAREQWHKICALLMKKLQSDEVEITIEDIERLAQQNLAVVLQERDGRLFIRLMTMEEGMKLAREHGGMPA